MSRYKHILWDWNGTLLDDRGLAHGVVNTMLAKRGLSLISMEKYLELFTHPVLDFYRAIGLGADVISMEEIAHEFASGYARGCADCHLQVGAVDALQVFRQAGRRQSILSASHTEALGQFVAHFGVREYFDVLVGLDNHHAHSKVDQGIRWLEQLALDPRDVVLIGDTDHDSEVAKRLACDCILVARGHQSSNRLQACGVPVISDLTELAKFGIL